MEDLPLGRIATLEPEFAVKDLPLGRTHDDDDDTIFFISYDLALFYPMYYFSHKYVLCYKLNYWNLNIDDSNIA